MVRMSLATKRLFTLKLVLGAMVLAQPTLAQRILTVHLTPGPSYSQLSLGGQVWLRLRGPGHVAEARSLAVRLTEQLLQGLQPGEVSTEKVDKNARLLARGKPLLLLTASQAAAQNSDAAALADRWATALKEILNGPYVAVAPIDPFDVPVGEVRNLSVGGTAAASARVVSLNPELLAVESGRSGEVPLRGLAMGDATVEVATASDKLRIGVRVRFWAATIPSNTSVFVTGPVTSGEWQRYSQYAVMTSVMARLGASVDVDHRPRQWPLAMAEVRAQGPEFLPLTREVAIQGQVKPRALPEPTHVLVSNYPERVKFAHVLMRDMVEKSEPVRILWHHVNDSGQNLWFGVRLHNLSDEPVHFTWADCFAGPNLDEIYVGHVVCRGYFDQLRRGSAVMLSLQPHRWVEFATMKTRPRQIVSGLACISVLGGGPLVAEVVAHPEPPSSWARPVADNLREDPKLRPFRFEGVNELTATHVAGGPWTFVGVGKQPKSNSHGIVLHGNYGVLYRIRFLLANPKSERAYLELVVRSGGGATRGVFMLNGDILETPMLRATQEHMLTRWELPPRSEREVSVLTMPQSGSNYPVTLVVRPRR